MLVEADLVRRDRQTDRHTDQLLRPPLAHVPRVYKYGLFWCHGDRYAHNIDRHVQTVCNSVVCAYSVRCNVVELHCFSEFL